MAYFDEKFPAKFFGTSPVVVTKNGAEYTVSLNVQALSLSLAAITDVGADPTTKLIWFDGDRFSISTGSAWAEVWRGSAYLSVEEYADPAQPGKVLHAIEADAVGGYTATQFDEIAADIVALQAAGAVEDAVSITANTTINTTHGGKFLNVDATAGNVVITIPATTSGFAENFITRVRRIDTSTNSVTLVQSSNLMAALSVKNDMIGLLVKNSTWEPRDIRIEPFAAVLTTTGTLTIPRWAKYIDVDVVGGGGGGGSGRRGAAGTVRLGGNGGNSGEFNYIRSMYVPNLGTFSVAYTIGAAGAAGAAQTVDSTNGNAGGAGGFSRFGAGTEFFTTRAEGGVGGLGGTATTNTQTAVTSKTVPSGLGGTASATGGNGGIVAGAQIPGGAAGGGLTTANVTGTGGAGRGLNGNIAGGSSAGAAGTSSTLVLSTKFVGRAESGGGGAAGDGVVAGGAGGAPSGYGAGGSGGGASLNGLDSGAGSAGSPGAIGYRLWY